MLWQVLEQAHWPLLVIDESRRVRFANPGGRAWFREANLAVDCSGRESLAENLPPDAEQIPLDHNTGLWLIQRKSSSPARQSSTLMDADSLIFRLERTLETTSRLGQIVSASEFTLALYQEIESLYGRREADSLLDQIRTRVHSQLKRGEFAGYLGAGRLVVVSISHPTQEDAFQSTARWSELLSRPFRVGLGEHASSVSAGVAISPMHGRDATLLLDHAAAAAFSAQKQGRGTIWPFSEAMARRMQDDMALESALAKALTSDEFSLAFQPKVKVDGEQITLIGIEALLRWHSASLGFVPPSRFIPIAERSGLMPEIGRIVLEKVCLQIARWRSEGWSPPPVAVNVSNHEFNQGDFRLRFDRTIKHFKIEPSALQIEITESALLKDVDHGIHILKSMKAEGIGLAIDDFGTGYSSLSYLRRFPADLLKIDRSFVVDAENDNDAREVLGGIVRLAKSLKMDVVAEGIETPEQRDILLSLGCSCFQGYFFGKPMPASELLESWASDMETRNAVGA